MEGFDKFAENLKTFWNQPVPIIGFSVGMCIIGFAFIFGKTSLGKKALNKLKELYYDLKARFEVALEIIKDTRKEFEEFKEEKEKQIVELTESYEAKLYDYRERLNQQDEMIKVICENTPNKHIKQAYEKYCPVDLETNTNETIERIREDVRKEYESRLRALEEKIYGKAEETENG